MHEKSVVIREMLSPLKEAIFWILNFKNKRVKKFRTLQTDRELS